MKKLIFTSIIFLLTGTMAFSQSIPADSLYLGQTPPDNMPLIFAPGIISLPGRTEYGISISPDGAEMLFAIGNWPDKRTMIMEYKNSQWSNPDTVSFSTTRSAEEAIYSPDGQRVYYYAYNPPNPVGGADLCYSVKSGSVWSEPVNLGTPLNTPQSEYHPCFVADSSVYFENASGKICYSKYMNGSYQPRIILPSLFNDQGNAWGNPFVSPDESYFIFNSSRSGGFGGTDLYISYKKVDGTWTNPKNLGNVINTPTNECGSEITDDNLYLTYVSDNDIYWVSSDFIDSLRYTNFLPYVKYPIPDQTGIVGETFSYTISDSTFMDDDGINTLSYNAILSDGNPLPSWLPFDSLSATFSGIPPEAGILEIRVTALDTAGAGVSTTFKIRVNLPTGSDKFTVPGISIFPNPSNGIINIDLNTLSGKTAIAEICNPEGKTIHKDTFESFTRIDMTNDPKGIYILKLIIENEVTVCKIIIQ
ncbi:MAG: T9SS type A sorting domain-containing protein [Bacteroidales bacterium]|nr:T9SS type A sorting domain-containing protein [Bacteroidales bacterium]